MKEKNEISKELQEAINRCKKAQQEIKKRQQQYCINKYYEKRDADKEQ